MKRKMQKRKTQGLNDGYAALYKPKERKTDFSAAISPKSLDDMDYFVDMAYQEQYKREQDYEFANSSGHSLSLKIRTLLYEDVTKDHKAVIGNVLYNILKIDHARGERVMYLYLEEERKLAEPD